MLNITDGGFVVNIAGSMIVDTAGHGDIFINMASGGMLMLRGYADESLGDFLKLVYGTGAIRYWKGISGWQNITEATYGVDYTLSMVKEYLRNLRVDGFGGGDDSW